MAESGPDSAPSPANHRKKSHPLPRWSRRFRWTTAAVLVLLVISVVLSAVWMRWAERVMHDEFRRRLELAARDLAAGLPTERVEEALKDEGGGESASSRVIGDLFDAWRAWLPEGYDVSLMTIRRGRAVVGPASGGEPGRARLEARAADGPSREVLRALVDGGIAEWIDSDGRGWMLAAAPIWDPLTGVPMAATVLSGPAELDWRIARRARWEVLRSAGLLALVLMAGVAVLAWRERQTAAIRLRWRHLETLLTAGFGLLALSGVLRVVTVAQERERQLQLRHTADVVSGAVRMALREVAAHHASLVRFFSGSELVTAEEYAGFATPLLRRMPVSAVLWVPRIAAGEPVAPEAQRLSQQAAAVGETVAAPPRYRAPVQYAVPAERARGWIGRDLADDPVLAAALDRAAREQGLVMSDAITSADAQALPDWRCLIEAVRRPGREDRTPDGWIVSVLQPSAIVNATIGRIAGAGPSLEIELIELPAPKGLTQHALRYPLVWGGRSWALMCRQLQPATAAHPFWPARPLQFWGLATVATLTALVGLVCSREVRLEREVLARTRELREREENLRVTLHAIHDGVIATDADGRVTLLNPEAERLTGWSAAEAIGRDCAEVFRIVAGATGEPAPDPVQQALTSGRAVGLANDIVLLARDGRRIRIADSAAPIRLPDHPRPIGVVLVFRDVGADYAAREALAASERRYRQLFEEMDDGFALHEIIRDQAGRPVDYRFLEINPAFERQTGLRAEELLGRTLREALPGTELEWVEIYGRVASTGQTERFEMHHAPTGRTYHVTAYCPEPGRFATLFFDVTDRHRAAMELQRQRQLLHDIIETVQEGIAVLDRDLTVRFTNGTMRRWYEPNLPLEGRKCHVVFHNKGEPCAQCPTIRCLASGRPEGEIVPGLPGSPVEWVELYAYPMRDPVTGEVTGVVEFVRDITARRKAEEEKRRIEARMTEVQRLESLGVLAGGIAHDFNNILMAILGNAELAAQDLPSHSPVRVNLQEIALSARRAAELCRQMLAYAGRGRFVVEIFDLNRLVDEMLGLLRTTISKRAVLNVHLEPNIPPVRADPSQIRQVVMNLVINASEALGDRSGTITVRTGVTRCDRAYLDQAAFETNLPEGLYVLLEVADTGCGMDPATLGRIFEPFFTTKFAGRGLGLSAVLGIVRAHKGGIKVYSEPGKGSLFKVLLPASPAPIVEEPALLPELAGHEGGLVLFVDDEESVRALGGRMLERMGFRVVLAADGREALEMFSNRPKEWVLVVLDLTMPRMDGEETFRRLREVRPDLPVILASGYTADELSARFASKGFAGFLQKPFTIAELQKAAAVALRGHSRPRRREGG
ncbi:MAG: PAS domain S-box protein [Kiritimatiellae bacterium]|nr:PAS domain S-box protein [Kiritimatiellia bacterium]